MLDWLLPTVAMAQTGPATGGGGQRFIAQLLLILSFVLIFYFLLLRPQQRRQKQTQQMLRGLKTGDRVLTSGGIIGQVQGIKDDVVVLKISDNVKVEFAKNSIQAVVPK